MCYTQNTAAVHPSTSIPAHISHYKYKRAKQHKKSYISLSIRHVALPHCRSSHNNSRLAAASIQLTLYFSPKKIIIQRMYRAIIKYIITIRSTHIGTSSSSSNNGSTNVTYFFSTSKAHTKHCLCTE